MRLGLVGVTVALVLATAALCYVSYRRGAGQPLGAKEWLSGLFAAAMVIFALLSIFLEERFADSESITGTARISSPDSGETSPMCVRVEGTADLGEAETLVIGVKTAQERWYFEGSIDWEADREEWAATVQLGDPADQPVDPYTIAAVAMPSELADYLTSTNSEEDATWWSSPHLPGFARSLDDVRVSRSDTVAC